MCHVLYSGGVTLHFHGNHLNASAAPRLVIYVEEESFSNVRRNVVVGTVVHFENKQFCIYVATKQFKRV